MAEKTNVQTRWASFPPSPLGDILLGDFEDEVVVKRKGGDDSDFLNTTRKRIKRWFWQIS
jgi:hypothetical protein